MCKLFNFILITINHTIMDISNLEHLSNPIHIQIHHIQGSELLQVDSIKAHVSVVDELATVGHDWVADAVGHDIGGHPLLDAKAVGDLHLFYCHSV